MVKKRRKKPRMPGRTAYGVKVKSDSSRNSTDDEGL